MSFEEKLRELGLKEDKEREQRETSEEEKRRFQKEEDEWKKEETERLLRIAEEKLFPTFKLVNEAYLKGKGAITLEVGEHIDRRYFPLKSGETESVVLNLDWDAYDNTRLNFEILGGKRLKLILDNNLDIKLIGGDDVKSEFNLNDENWEHQLKDGISLILSVPGATDWSWSRLDLSR